MSASSLSDGFSFLVLITSSSLPSHLCPIIAVSLSPFRHLCIMIISTFIIPYSFHVLMPETRALYYPFKTASQVPTNGDSIPYSVTACDHFATLRPFKPSGPVEDREEEYQEQGETCQGDEGCCQVNHGWYCDGPGTASSPVNSSPCTELEECNEIVVRQAQDSGQESPAPLKKEGPAKKRVVVATPSRIPRLAPPKLVNAAFDLDLTKYLDT
ncbi:MAG: hypothetical protein LQ341_002848 [Variospora aurantia]|nr:MAG: hypothetical protein LQ341_002848 [Variospora aurantia]